MTKHPFLRMKDYLKRYLYVQLIVSMTSLPILVSWGLPFSIASLMGNLLFSPFITIFLATSSVIFLADLINLPNGMAISFLELLTQWLHYLLKLGKKEWLLRFSNPSPLILCTLFCISVFIFYHFIHRSLTTKIAILGILFGLNVGYLSLSTPNVKTKTLNQGKAFLTATCDQRGLLVVNDQGLFNRKASPPSFVQFELIPYLAKEFGMRTIHKLIVSRLTKRSLEAAHQLCTLLNVTAVHLTIPKKFKDKSLQQNLKDFQESLATQRISLTQH